jgi:hypothetical protein
VVNVTEGEPNTFEGVETRRGHGDAEIAGEDRGMQYLSVRVADSAGSDLLEHFPAVVAFIENILHGTGARAATGHGCGDGSGGGFSSDAGASGEFSLDPGAVGGIPLDEGVQLSTSQPISSGPAVLVHCTAGVSRRFNPELYNSTLTLAPRPKP